MASNPPIASLLQSTPPAGRVAELESLADSHAMNLFAPLKPFALDFMRAGALVLVFLSGLLTAFVSQASSPDYRRLFWSVLPVAVFHFALALVYFLRVRHWTRWGALGLAIVALGFLGEMTLRVWL